MCLIRNPMLWQSHLIPLCNSRVVEPHLTDWNMAVIAGISHLGWSIAHSNLINISAQTKPDDILLFTWLRLSEIWGMFICVWVCMCLGVQYCREQQQAESPDFTAPHICALKTTHHLFLLFCSAAKQAHSQPWQRENYLKLLNCGVSLTCCRVGKKGCRERQRTQTVYQWLSHHWD